MLYRSQPRDSPPRMRSGPLPVDLDPCERRLTSARAERTTPPQEARPGTTTHLRACGADTAAVAWGTVLADSPPRMRSGLLGAHTSVSVDRLTSAHAERTSPPRVVAPFGPTHLRACGADGFEPYAAPSSRDSPPRMRSGRRAASRGARAARLTSAHAERTAAGCARPSARPTHLRACGADLDTLLFLWLAHDSPPRMRSGPFVDPSGAVWPRLTSAHAERTPEPAPARPAAPTHLRACGADPSRPATLDLLCN